ncbi:Rhodanese domain protein [Ferroglobus placidus DSM 10642]|uniref:Rhodanese domain protein n=1 Tax=Ferroglobus placidus (strain DSM 10642 / AEDII12DO) TaxID=589924 RepID=D3RYB1_FERPA|nr:rhodanese-like domain-containing protein [Ferroglobus placidus]ADC65474.1 Rhodanese domain protein [Ferroglobus placidus DSM 10642]
MKLVRILLIFSLIFAGCLQAEKGIYKDISVDEAYELIQKNKNNPNFVILDIRTPEEFKSEHIDGAINIDFYSPNFKEELKKLDKNKTYLIYCRTGHRTSLAMPLFKELGFKEVYNMLGGITAWKNRGYPVVR